MSRVCLVSQEWQTLSRSAATTLASMLRMGGTAPWRPPPESTSGSASAESGSTSRRRRRRLSGDLDRDGRQGRLLGLFVELAQEEPVQHLRPPRKPDGSLVLRVLQQTQRQHLPRPPFDRFIMAALYIRSMQYSMYDLLQL